MQIDLFIEKFRKHLTSHLNRRGNPYGDYYIKDKVSRLKRLLEIVDVADLDTLSDENFFKISDFIILSFKKGYVSSDGKVHRQYGDYMVVLRQIYYMNTKKLAPRYAYYGGVLRPNARM